jgi:hypothetical protein
MIKSHQVCARAGCYIFVINNLIHFLNLFTMCYVFVTTNLIFCLLTNRIVIMYLYVINNLIFVILFILCLY